MTGLSTNKKLTEFWYEPDQHFSRMFSEQIGIPPDKKQKHGGGRRPTYKDVDKRNAVTTDCPSTAANNHQTHCTEKYTTCKVSHQF
jgi:hypothetical protein